MAKRLFDLVSAFAGLVAVSPVFLIVGILVKLEDKGPVFFRQERIGWRGRPFRIWKFRTMVVDAEKMGSLITVGDDPRITRVGSFLRATKIDELPQLINVVVGQMSMVGPRPEVAKYVALYNDEQRKVLDLRPGMTDPASIHFRQESTLLALDSNPETAYIEYFMPEKIRINLEYTKRRSLWGDIVLVLKTIYCLMPVRNRNRSEHLDR